MSSSNRSSRSASSSTSRGRRSARSQRLAPRASSRVLSVAVAEVGNRRLAISGDERGSLQRWDLRTMARLGPPMKGHDEWIRSLAIVPDGKRTLLASAGGERVWIWDLALGKPAGKKLDCEARVVGTAI